MSAPAPTSRVQRLNRAPPRADGEFVLCWMTANRRARWNFALQHAVAWAQALDRPLVVVETLSCEDAWASARQHRFILDGMSDQHADFDERRVLYHPFVGREPGDVPGLIEALAGHACAVVCDALPAAWPDPERADLVDRLSVQLVGVDATCIVPMSVPERAYPTAYGFRRFLQGCLAEHLAEPPLANPLAGCPLPPSKPLPASVLDRWPAVDLRAARDPRWLAALPVDQGVAPVTERGGARAASVRLRWFLASGLSDYLALGRHPDAEGTSGLSAHLHFGQLSAHEVLEAVLVHEDRFVEDLPTRGQGARSGWWGMSDAAEAFVDQLITWRELSFNMCQWREDFARYESLPDWARQTLDEHASDPRESVYELETFDRAETHDELWNAAQRQLKQSGRLHSYLRMLWGKKILEWTRSPREALDSMLRLNNRYALDGVDPVSYSGIFWILGRYDRAWGPERPVYGKIRSMSSDNTRRKLRLREYLERWGAECLGAV